MSRSMLCLVSVLGTVALFAQVGTVSAQWFPTAFGGNNCQCVQPVAQACYRSVPVTELRAVQRTVQRPVIETTYVDQQVTAYRPITETRTASVPTVSYQNVTELRTVQRDYGGWQTSYAAKQRISPCQYDSRPDLLGWLNRTGYSIRQSFTPQYTAHRQYVPNVVVQQIPVTRQVAIRGTRQVTYNVTRMEAYSTTRKVAVNTVRQVAQQVTVMQPVTVMRTVPIGSSVAYAVTPFSSGIATTLVPQPDPNFATARGGQPAKRTADSRSEFERSGGTAPEKYRRNETEADDIKFDSSSTDDNIRSRRASLTQPVRRAPVNQAYPEVRGSRSTPHYTAKPIPRTLSIVRAGRWISRRRVPSSGPKLSAPMIAVAGTTR